MMLEYLVGIRFQRVADKILISKLSEMLLLRSRISDVSWNKLKWYEEHQLLGPRGLLGLALLDEWRPNVPSRTNAHVNPM